MFPIDKIIVHSKPFQSHASLYLEKLLAAYPKGYVIDPLLEFNEKPVWIPRKEKNAANHKKSKRLTQFKKGLLPLTYGSLEVFGFADSSMVVIDTKANRVLACPMILNGEVSNGGNVLSLAFEDNGILWNCTDPSLSQKDIENLVEESLIMRCQQIKESLKLACPRRFHQPPEGCYFAPFAQYPKLTKEFKNFIGHSLSSWLALHHQDKALRILVGKPKPQSPFKHTEGLSSIVVGFQHFRSQDETNAIRKGITKFLYGEEGIVPQCCHQSIPNIEKILDWAQTSSHDKMAMMKTAHDLNAHRPWPAWED